MDAFWKERNFTMDRLCFRVHKQGRYKIWKTWKSHWILKNFRNTWKSHGVLKEWLEILKSPLLQTLNNYFRIFSFYQKNKRKKRRKKENKTWEKDKYQTKCKNWRKRNGKLNWKSKKNLKASKKKFINWLKLDEFIYRRN